MRTLYPGVMAQEEKPFASLEERGRSLPSLVRIQHLRSWKRVFPRFRLQRRRFRLLYTRRTLLTNDEIIESLNRVLLRPRRASLCIQRHKKNSYVFAMQQSATFNHGACSYNGRDAVFAVAAKKKRLRDPAG